jgi:hypothetical protein
MDTQPRKLVITETPSAKQRKVLRAVYGGKRYTTEQYKRLRARYNRELPQLKRQYKERKELEARQQRSARFIQDRFRFRQQRRPLEINDWSAEIERKLAQQGISKNEPFTLKLRSAGLFGVEKDINFNNFYNFENWALRIIEGEMGGGSEPIVEYRVAVADYGEDAFKRSYISVSRIAGGCNVCVTGQQMILRKEVKCEYNTYNIYNPPSKRNNCGFACLEYMLDIKLKYSKVRKEYNLKAEQLVEPNVITSIYKQNETNGKFLTIIDRDYCGILNFDICDYILYHKNHYQVVESVKQNKHENKRAKVKRKLLAYDFETRVIDPNVGIQTGKSKRYQQIDTICSIHTEKQTITFETESFDKRSARKFLDWLEQEHRAGRHYTIVAHNGSRFDNIILQSVMTENEKLNYCEFQYRGYSIIGMSYLNHIFRDPCCFLVGSLDRLCKSFKVTNAKQTTDIYNGMDNKQLCFYKPELGVWEFMKLKQSEPEYWKAYVEYCEVDCISLTELWNKFVSNTTDLIVKMAKGEWILRKCSVISKTTIGGLAKKLIDTLNNDKCWGFQHYKKFIGDDIDKYEYICKFKRGGISHCNQPGKHNRSVGGVDITSQYPTALIHMKVPSMNSQWVTEYDPDMYGYYTITDLAFDDSAKKFKPICPQPTKEQSILNWTADWNEDTECNIDSEMLKYMIKYCGLVHFKVVKGLVSNKYVKGEALFGQYVKTLFAEKGRQDELKGTDEYNQAYREVCKLFMNSLTGKLVEDPSKYYQLSYTSNPDDPKNNIGGIGFNKEQTQQPFNLWVNAGVMVYSYSKRLLWEYIRYLPNNADDVVHIETDGIYAHTDDLEIMEKRLKDYDGEYPVTFGSDLGNVKWEHKSKGASYWLGKKLYFMDCKLEGEVMRVKGLPQNTIDEYGNTKKIVDKSFYEDLYNWEQGDSIQRTFGILYKKVFGELEISSMRLTRTITPQMKYHEFN